ncbi:MAG TPA: DUF2249 domain-containing protein [Opitutaceae bacterium]|nr:DUF2249 domain-containing protein [Opitutaceae bacterium]
MKPEPPRKVRLLDTRPLIARGEEPRAAVFAAVAALAPGESLVLVTPFLPSPLIERLQADGFSIRPERRTDGSWQTHFSRP